MSDLATSPGIEVRPFQAEDLPRVLDFLRRAFPTAPHKSDERFFRWQFLDSPLGSSAETYLLAWQGEKLVGQLATMRDRLWIASAEAETRTSGEWRDVLWLVDLFVLPEARNSLAGLRLFQAMMRRPELLLTVGAGPALASLYESLGWRRWPVAKTFYLPIRPRQLIALAEATGRPVAGRLLKLAAKVGDWVCPRLLKSAARAWKPTASSRETMSDFSPDWSAFLNEAMEPTEITPQRSAERLKWKLFERPDQRGLMWTVRDGMDGPPRGLLAARVRQRAIGEDGGGPVRWLEIVDYVNRQHDSSALPALIATAVQYALGEQLDFVRLRLSRPGDIAALPRYLWRERTLPVTDEVFTFSTDAELLALCAESPWHLTSLVSDRAEESGASET